MPTLDQIRESIEAQIAELQREITALEAARAALHGERAAATESMPSRRRAPTRRRRRRRVAEAASNGNRAAVAIPAVDGAAVDEPVAKVDESVDKTASKPASGSDGSDGSDGAARKPRKRVRARSDRTGQSVEVLLAGKLEAMLREAESGLSAITLSKHSNAGYSQVLGLLRELEATGQVRRSGTRRTSLWRLVSDEERIAERVAEIEALVAAKTPSGER